MCTAIALALSELPSELIAAHDLDRRLYARGGEPEVRFQWRDAEPLLPVWWAGRLRILRWGNRDRRSRLPPTGWTWEATVEAGGWAGLAAEPCDVAATYGCENGVWFAVRQGVRGLVVPDEQGTPVVYLVCRPPTRYFQIMCRSERMPVLIGEVI